MEFSQKAGRANGCDLVEPSELEQIKRRQKMGLLENVQRM